MKAWFNRFGLHLTAAVGATGIFVAAAVAGASETRQQTAAISPPASPTRPHLVVSPSPQVRPIAPSAAASASPAGSPAAAVASPAPQPRPDAATPVPKVNPERSIAGTIKNVSGDGLQVLTKANKDVRVTPFQGALIRLNGKTVPLSQLQPGDTVVVLGQQMPTNAPNVIRFQAHAITARRT